MKDDVTRRVQDRVVKGLPPIMGDVEELLLALAAKDTEIAGLKRDIIFANGELEKINDKIVALKKPIAKLAALTADLAARGETIARLEGVVAAQRFDVACLKAQAGELTDKCAILEKQLIEERWQKDRAEWFLKHSLCAKDACGLSPDPSQPSRWRHKKWDWTPDDWRRDAREQWEAEHTVKASPK